MFPPVPGDMLAPAAPGAAANPFRATHDWTVYLPEGLKLAEPAWDDFVAMMAAMLPQRLRERPEKWRGLYLGGFTGAFQKAWVRRGYAMYGVMYGMARSEVAEELAAYGLEGRKDDIFDLSAIPSASFDFAVLDRVICSKHFYQQVDSASGPKAAGAPSFAPILRTLKPGGVMIGILYQWYSEAIVRQLAGAGELTLWPFKGERILGFTLRLDSRPTTLPDPMTEPMATSPWFEPVKDVPRDKAAVFIPTNELITQRDDGRVAEFAPPILEARAPAPVATWRRPEPDPLCEVCGGPMNGHDRTRCPKCNSAVRTRSVAHAMSDLAAPLLDNDAFIKKPALCFSMDGMERQILSRHLPNLKSVSLYGNYHAVHEMGVDARDLSRFADREFCMAYSCAMFDYFTEHEQALREAYRVLAPGGVFLTYLEPPRILDGDAAPFVAQKVMRRPGYYDYVPEDHGMVSIRVGRDWLLEAMRRVGFEARSQKFTDASSGEQSEWFVGRTPRA